MDRARAWLAGLAVALLAGCQQGFPLLPGMSEPAEPGWRVVERLGEARYLAPGMSGWDNVVPGGMIPIGSQITTGIGGRLIVDHGGNQLSAGTGSRFILPGWEPGDGMRQTAGRLRYRIDGARPAAFAIETPFLEVLVDDAVLDVTVGEDATEVAVVRGNVRLRTLDGVRQIDLDAGYSGYASLQGQQLAVRQGLDGDLREVPPAVLPALQPERTGVDAMPASTPAPALLPAPRATMLPEPQSILEDSPADPGPVARSMIPGLPVKRPAAMSAAAADGEVAAVAPNPADRTIVALPAIAANREVASAPPARREPSYWQAIAADQAPFERLTHGLLDGLPRAQPAEAPRASR